MLLFFVTTLMLKIITEITQTIITYKVISFNKLRNWRLASTTIQLQDGSCAILQMQFAQFSTINHESCTFRCKESKWIVKQTSF